MGENIYKNATLDPNKNFGMKTTGIFHGASGARTSSKEPSDFKELVKQHEAAIAADEKRLGNKRNCESKEVKELRDLRGAASERGMGVEARLPPVRR